MVDCVFPAHLRRAIYCSCPAQPYAPRQAAGLSCCVCRRILLFPNLRTSGVSCCVCIVSTHPDRSLACPVVFIDAFCCLRICTPAACRGV